MQEKATPANKTLYNGTVLEALTYAYQFHQTGGAPVYTLYDFALVDAGKQTNQGVEWVDIDGPNGPVELEKAQPTPHPLSILQTYYHTLRNSIWSHRILELTSWLQNGIQMYQPMDAKFLLSVTLPEAKLLLLNYV